MSEKLSRGEWLNHAEVRSLAETRGKHRIGPRVQLVIVRPGKGFVEWRYQIAGRSRALGLGGWPDTPLAEIRDRAEGAAALRRQGIDPIVRRHAAARAANGMTFRQAVEASHAAHAPAWSAKHGQAWEATLRTYAAPLDALPVAAVDTEAVLKCLSPIWITKPVTASRLRGRIEATLDYAKALGQRDGENPARWRGHLKLLLPATGKIHMQGHYAAMPWQAVPEFMARLRRREGIAYAALQFVILTCARSAEARGALWAEINMSAATWTIPAQRMKGGREHRVPLSPAALDVLHAVTPLHQSAGDCVFPGDQPGRPLASATLLEALRRLGHNFETVHGFRAAFSTWAAEATEYPRELVEAALAHVIGGSVERAYSRTDRIDRRRALMDAWAAYCCGHAPA
jgi:integrase